MIEVRVEDLAFYAGDAIVRPATATLDATTPLLRRLEVAAAKHCATARASPSRSPSGSAVVTGAGELPAKLLVHAVVTQRHGARHARRSAARVAKRARTSPFLADRRVAIPPLGLGAGNLDIDESAELMADELARHLATAAFPKRVTLIAETPDEALALEGAIARRVEA